MSDQLWLLFRTVTHEGEFGLFRHLGAERDLIRGRVLFGVPAKFEECDDPGKRETDDEDDEYAADAVHPQGGGSRVFFIGFDITENIVRIGGGTFAPPFVLVPANDAQFLHFEDGEGYLVPPG